MGWFNYYGLIFIAFLMLPNIIYAIKQKQTEVPYRNKAVEIVEQIGRYGTMFFTAFNIPYVYLGFWFENALAVYLAVNGLLVLAYCIMWVVLWKSSSLIKALTLSVLPTVVFLLSGILLLNVPLVIFAVLFGFAHIWLSCKTALQK